MPTFASTGINFRAVVVFVSVVLLARCDLPTEAPRFDLTTGLTAPLLVDKTFVLIGPSDTGFDALIDTTSSRFDSIFTVNASDHTIAILQEMEGFRTELSEGVLPSLELASIDISFAADDITADERDESSQADLLFKPNGQSFGADDAAALDMDGVHFSSDADYAQLSAGTLRIESLINEFDVAFDEVLISLPSLRSAPYGPTDTLVIRFHDLTDAPDDLRFRMIDRKSGPRSEEVDLTGYRLYAQGDEITYSVYGRNETSNEARIIRTSEHLRLAVGIEDAVVSALVAELDPLEISISEDVNQDGRHDVLDDAEADVAAFDGLQVFDTVNLGSFQLAGSALRLHVRTNIAADFALYAVIVGLNDEDEPVYLKGKGSAAVDPGEFQSRPFSANGTPVDPENMIRLDVAGASSPDLPTDQILVLDAENSNVDAFVSHVPTELRTTSLLVIQPHGGRVHLREPFLLETTIATRIPLAVTSGFSIDKTFKANLSSLEDVATDSSRAALEAGELELGYANGLPLGLDLQVDVLDDAGGVVASFPKTGQSLHVEPAATNASGLAEHPTDGLFKIVVSRNDLKTMSRGEQIRLQLALKTDGDGLARLRATDTFTMRLHGRFDIRIIVD